METRTPDVRKLRLRVMEVSEAKAGRFARVRVRGIEGPGRMRFFDIPAEDFQVGDQLEFSLVCVVRELAAEPESNGITEALIAEPVPGISGQGAGAAEIVWTASDVDELDPERISPADIEAGFGHETIHPHPEGA